MALLGLVPCKPAQGAQSCNTNGGKAGPKAPSHPIISGPRTTETPGVVGAGGRGRARWS